MTILLDFCLFVMLRIIMKDPRGVERGACKNCECTDYELEAGATRAQCSYCECPATAHETVTPKGKYSFSFNSTVFHILLHSYEFYFYFFLFQNLKPYDHQAH